MNEITDLEKQIQTLTNRLHALRHDQAGEEVTDYVFSTGRGRGKIKCPVRNLRPPSGYPQ